MKKHFFLIKAFLALFFSIQITTAHQLQIISKKTFGYPKPINRYINDFADLIDANHKDLIIKLLTNIDKQTGIEITIVTINSIHDYRGTRDNFEKFATELFNTWGIGKRENNNGILFLIALKDRKVRIELGRSYPSFYNSIAKRIINVGIIPSFKEERFSQGIYIGSIAIANMVTREISWFDFYKWRLLLALLYIIFAITGILCLKFGWRKLGWMFLGLTLFASICSAIIFAVTIFLSLIKIISVGESYFDSGDSDDGGGFFGGGGSDGGGASGDW